MLFTFRGGHLRDGESGGTPLPLLPLPYSSGADRDREPLVKAGGRPIDDDDGAGCGRLGELLGRLAPPLPLPAPTPLADDREKPLPVIAGMVPGVLWPSLWDPQPTNRCPFRLASGQVNRNLNELETKE